MEREKEVCIIFQNNKQIVLEGGKQYFVAKSGESDCFDFIETES